MGGAQETQNLARTAMARLTYHDIKTSAGHRLSATAGSKRILMNSVTLRRHWQVVPYRLIARDRQSWAFSPPFPVLELGSIEMKSDTRRLARDVTGEWL
jgi:hypothetical protein